jgi:hypothetical protein
VRLKRTCSAAGNRLCGLAGTATWKAIAVLEERYNILLTALNYTPPSSGEIYESNFKTRVS